MVKNDSSRVGGFSPAQWVLGKAPRSMTSAMSEEQFAELGASEARHDPSSIFALQHMARIEAQKAYVHLDCSRRVPRALTRNASAFPREYSVGDLVAFRRDNQRGGTSWSPASRVIGHEGPKNLWLLCGNVPVLVAAQNVRIASPSEALAQAVLNGAPVIPDSIVNGGGQQSFLDARRIAAPDEDDTDEDDELPPVEDDSVWNVRPGIFDGSDIDDDNDGPDEETSTTRRPEDRDEARAMFACFLSQQVEGDEEAPGKKVLKVIHFDSAPPDVQGGLRASRAKEWNKFVQFAAAIPVVGQQREQQDMLSYLPNGSTPTKLSTRRAHQITPRYGRAGWFPVETTRWRHIPCSTALKPETKAVLDEPEPSPGTRTPCISSVKYTYLLQPAVVHPSRVRRVLIIETLKIA
eukprot:s1054_g2.t2